MVIWAIHGSQQITDSVYTVSRQQNAVSAISGSCIYRQPGWSIQAAGIPQPASLGPNTSICRQFSNRKCFFENLVISVGRSGPWDDLSLVTFCLWDLISGDLTSLGRFIPQNVLYQDVLSVHQENIPILDGKIKNKKVIKNLVILSFCKLIKTRKMSFFSMISLYLSIFK